MNFKRLLAFLTVTCMAVTAFSGCAVTQKAPESNQTTSSKQESQAAKDEPSIASPSWKSDTSEHTVKWFLSYDWYGKKFNPAENSYDKHIKDETGCTIEIQTGDMDKFNVLIQTDSLPDVITTDAVASQRIVLENEKRLLPLNQLKAQYAPDLHVPESETKWYTADDGNWYSIVNFYYGDDNVKDNNGYLETHNQNFAREDILKKIGMTTDDMRTKEGFLKALRAVKDRNIEYNGIKMMPYAALIAEGALEHIAYQFGASQETKDGKFISIYRTPEFLEAVKFYNQMYSEKLLTDESFTMKKDQIQQMVASGKLFATSVWSNVAQPRESLYAADNSALMMYCGDIQGDSHDKVAIPSQASAGWASTMINKKANKPERIIQLFSFLSQKESVFNHEWAVGGWSIGNNGKLELNEQILKEKATDPASFNAKHGGDLPWLTDYTFVQGMALPADTILGKDVEKRIRDDKIIIYDEKCFAIPMESGSDVAAIETRISEYKNQEIARIITAASGDVDKMYAEMLKNMDGFGLDKVEAFQNEKFQENKKQLGVDFVHPFNK